MIPVAIALFILTMLFAFFVWKTRRANRLLWKALEDVRRESGNRTRLDRHLWQRCYGRLVAVQKNLPVPVHLTSQHAEDVFLLDYFEGMPPGVFVEVGAYDGIQFSNTYALEQIGWKGLLVEAHPENAKKCKKNRPNAIVEHAAAGDANASGMISFNMVEGRGGDLLSFIHADERHQQRCRREGKGIRTEEVPFLPLDSLLETHGMTTIDFLSIDIEGGEADAIRGICFERIRPRLILLEANHKQARNELRALMTSLDYSELRQFDANLLFEDRRTSEHNRSGGFLCELLS